MNSVTSLSTLSLQGIMACRITSRVALQRTYRDKCHFYRLYGCSFCCMQEKTGLKSDGKEKQTQRNKKKCPTKNILQKLQVIIVT